VTLSDMIVSQYEAHRIKQTNPC